MPGSSLSRHLESGVDPGNEVDKIELLGSESRVFAPKDITNQNEMWSLLPPASTVLGYQAFAREANLTTARAVQIPSIIYPDYSARPHVVIWRFRRFAKSA